MTKPRSSGRPGASKTNDSPVARRAALEKAVGGAFEALYATMRDVRGDPKGEQDAWSTLVDALVDLRRAAGHLQPTLLLAEIVALEGWGKNEPTFDVLDADDAESERWMTQIVAAVARAEKAGAKKKTPAAIETLHDGATRARRVEKPGRRTAAAPAPKKSAKKKPAKRG